jgi:hypothetical protein
LFFPLVIFERIAAYKKVTVKLPVIPTYAPVPEPDTIGAVPVAVTVPEQVLVLGLKLLKALLIFLSSAWVLTLNEP